MGSRRLGCPLPTPPDSRALRLGTLTNLFVGDLLFFFFCCIKNNTCEDSPCIRTNEKIGTIEDTNLAWENFGSWMLRCTSVTQSAVWGSLEVLFSYMESSQTDMLLGQKE